MTSATSKMTLLSSVVPLYASSNFASGSNQQSSLYPHHPYHPPTSGSLFEGQSTHLEPNHHSNLYPLAPEDLSHSAQPSGMMSQVAHPLSQISSQPPNHHRHVSDASSISSVASGHNNHFDPGNYPQPHAVRGPLASHGLQNGHATSDAPFGRLPTSTESYNQYSASHHPRSSSTSSSSSPYTEPTSMSDGGNSPEGGLGSAPNVPGGRKASQSHIMRRARVQASPYVIRTDGLTWSAREQSSASTSSSLVRSNSVLSDAPSNAEDSLAEIIRAQSREGSVSDWNHGVPANSHCSTPLPHQTGLGSAGAFMDPYATVANVHGHAGPFGSNVASLGSVGPNTIIAGGLNRMTNTSVVGGMGAQMGRMTLDNSETYEALAHHIRTAVTTSAADRARQAFVQAWLNSSYISYPDGNVSRQGLYGSYLRICQQYDIKPINSASFGKAVRQSFANIKTRRLGVRGNSKYHYCGIRPATAKEADILLNLSRTEQPEPAHGSRASSFADEDLDSDDSSSRRVSHHSGLSEDFHHSIHDLDVDNIQPQTPSTARPNFTFGNQDNAGSRKNPDQSNPDGILAHGQHRGSNLVLPSLEHALSQSAPHGLDYHRCREFWTAYTDHLKGLLEVVKNYRFDQFELNLRSFWAGLDTERRGCATHPVVTSLIYRADALVYDEILDYLHAQTLTPMPQQAFGTLRQLAQNMEQVIVMAMEDYPNSFVGPKIELAARFGHLIVRHLGICQLAQALSGVFSNPSSLKEMTEAWDGIDFEAVRNQAALVTNCQHDTLGYCFDEFRQILYNPNATIEHFIAFVEETYDRCLQPTVTGDRGLSPRSLLVRWCFVSAQLIRDLTLRSASSFGSFQIVNLFFDEWLGFKVLRKVALHVAAVAASVDTTSGETSLQQQDIPNYNDPAPYPDAQLSSYHNFSAEDAEVNDELRTQSHHTSGPQSLPTSSSSAMNPGLNEYMLPPNISQEFATTHHQPINSNSSPHSGSSTSLGSFKNPQLENLQSHSTLGPLLPPHSSDSKTSRDSLTSSNFSHHPDILSSRSSSSSPNNTTIFDNMDQVGHLG